jgi:hypothetical protein
MTDQAPEQPYSDDTSDGTTAPKVKSSDDLAREAAGREHPEEGHDVRDYRPIDTEAADVPENPGYEEQKSEDVGDDAAVDENGD